MPDVRAVTGMSWRDKVKAARLPEKIVPLVMRGDLAVEHGRLVAEIEQAKERGVSSLAGKGTAVLEEQLRALEAEASDSVVRFKLRALPRSARAGDNRPTWRELNDAHPPRTEDGMMNLRDRIAGGINHETFPEPMLRACIIAVDEDDVPMNDADWAELMGALTEGHFDALVKASWDLNRDVVDVPFWSGGSKGTPTTGLA